MPVLFYLYFVLSVLVAIMAKIRGRWAWRWFLIALLITPLAASVLVVALPRQQLLPFAHKIVPTLTDCTIRIIRHSGVLDRLRPYVLHLIRASHAENCSHRGEKNLARECW